MNAIETELSEQAELNLLTGMGSVGYRSASYNQPDAKVWVQINFNKNKKFDQIVLVPTAWRHVQEGFIGDGFPREFKVIVGNKKRKGKVIAHHKVDNSSRKRIAPFVISCPDTEASWIRIVPIELSPRDRDDAYVFQLAEVFVFDEEENIALHQKVTASTRTEAQPEHWKHHCLVVNFDSSLLSERFYLRTRRKNGLARNRIV